MTIHLATDHAGFAHKEVVREWLQAEGYVVRDYGAYQYDEDDDFPDFIAKAALAVARKSTTDRAIIFGGSGQGEAMMANRFPGVRATVLYSDAPEIVTLSREHNDANVLSIGARLLSIDDTKRHIWNWLHTLPRPEQKYDRRNQKLEVFSKRLHT